MAALYQHVRGCITPEKAVGTPASGFIFFFLSLVPYYYEAQLATQGLGWFESHFILGYASKPYFSQANAWYWHLYPMQFFLPHSCYVSNDQV